MKEGGKREKKMKEGEQRGRREVEEVGGRWRR